MTISNWRISPGNSLDLKPGRQSYQQCRLTHNFWPRSFYFRITGCASPKSRNTHPPLPCPFPSPNIQLFQCILTLTDFNQCIFPLSPTFINLYISQMKPDYTKLKKGGGQNVSCLTQQRLLFNLCEKSIMGLDNKLSRATVLHAAAKQSNLKASLPHYTCIVRMLRLLSWPGKEELSRTEVSKLFLKGPEDK